MQLSQPRLEVCIATQTLGLWEGARLVKQWPCSTSKFGIGFTEGSNRTPLGEFRVMEKHGAGMPQRTIFKARKPAGEWIPANSPRLISSSPASSGWKAARSETPTRKALHLHPRHQRRTTDRPLASHGCIRLRNCDVAELFDLVEVGAPVWIGE